MMIPNNHSNYYSSSDRTPPLKTFVPDSNRIIRPQHIRQTTFIPIPEGPGMISPHVIQQTNLRNSKVLDEKPFVGILRKESSFPIGRGNQLLNGMQPLNIPNTRQRNNSLIAPSFMSRTPSLHSFEQLPNLQMNQQNVQPQIPRLNFGQLTQLHQNGMDISQNYGYHRPVQSISNPLSARVESSLDKYIERQNQLLSKVLISINRQNETERNQNRIEMQQKIQELELNKMQADLEMEKQKSRKLEKLQKTRSQRDLGHKKDKSSLSEALFGLIINQGNDSPNSKNYLSPRSLQKHEEDHDDGQRIEITKNSSLPMISPRTNTNKLRVIDGKHLYEDTSSSSKVFASKEEITSPRSVLTISENNTSQVRRPVILRRDVANGESVRINLPSLNDHSTLDRSVRNALHNSPTDVSLQYGLNTPTSDYYNNDYAIRPFDNSHLPSQRRLIPESQISLDKGEQNNNSSGEQVESTPMDRRKKTLKKRRVKTRVQFDERNEEEESNGMVRSREERKKKAHRRVAAFGWTMILGKLLYNEAKSRVFTRKKTFVQNVSGNIAQAYDMLKGYVLQVAGKEISNMITDAKYPFIFTTPYNKKSEKTFTALMDHFKLIFNKLIVQTHHLPTSVLNILLDLTRENSFLPNDYFSPFELKRLKFNTFGNIKEMTSSRIKLVLGGIIIIRVLIYFVIMHPWDTFREDKSKYKLEKLLNLGSILYNATMDVFKASVPCSQNNQSFLSVDMKIHPKKSLLRAIDDISPDNNNFKVEKDTGRDGDIIEGFYARHQLSSFFVENKKAALELKALIEGLLNILYEKVHEDPGVKVVKSMKEL